MDISKIPAGRNPPTDIHALIEIPLGGVPVKYEMDKASGTLFVDRFLHTAMFYPGNYGFIPQTLSEDGDPLDILVLEPVAVVPGAVIRCRPVGALIMTDQAGKDEKVLAVPVDALHPFYTGIRSYKDLPTILRSSRAFLSALQGPRKGQVDQDRRLGRRRGGATPDRRGDRTGQEPRSRRDGHGEIKTLDQTQDSQNEELGIAGRQQVLRRARPHRGARPSAIDIRHGCPALASV